MRMAIKLYQKFHFFTDKAPRPKVQKLLINMALQGYHLFVRLKITISNFPKDNLKTF